MKPSKITTDQRERLYCYLSLLEDKDKARFLLKCGYFFQYSNEVGNYAFIRIDSKRFKNQVAAFKLPDDIEKVKKAVHRPWEPTLASKLFNTPAYIFRRCISKDIIPSEYFGIADPSEKPFHTNIASVYEMEDYNRYIDLKDVLGV